MGGNKSIINEKENSLIFNLQVMHVIDYANISSYNYIVLDCYILMLHHIIRSVLVKLIF